MPHFQSAQEAAAAYRRLAETNERGGGMAFISVDLWAELFAMQRQQNIAGSALEIGVWYGFSSAFICGHLDDGEELVLVDKFMDENHFRPTFETMLGRYGSNVTFFKKDSFDLSVDTELAPWKGKLRFAHIDGEHSREAVENDLALVEPLLSEDGVIAVDDMLYFHAPQVSHGLFSYILAPDCPLKPFLFAFNKCYLARKGAHARYRDFALGLIDRLETDGRPLSCALSHRRMDPDYVGLCHREANMPRYAVVNQGFDSLDALEHHLAEQNP